MQSNIQIYNPNGTTLANLTFSSNSEQNWQVMGDNLINLNFSLPQPDNGINDGFIEIPVGAYVNYESQRYTLYNPSDFTKNGIRKFDYTLKLYSNQELLNDRIFINEPDGLSVFPLTARPEEFLTYIVRNMCYFETGIWPDPTLTTNWAWKVGRCITSNIQQTIQFNGVSCFEALRSVAEAFKTEWEVDSKTNTIHLHKVEYNRESPLELSYGIGKGFLPGVGRANYDQNRPVHKLYVKGGERNIDFLTYGSQNLLLPKSTTLRYDGTYFQGQIGYNSSLAREYQTSTDGTYLTRIGVSQTSRREAFIELSEAYPKYVGTITNVIWKYGETGIERANYQDALSDAISAGSNAGSVFCDVFDINNVIDYKNLRIGGENAILVPQTGRLSGVEIGIQQSENSIDGYIHSEKRFKLVTDGFNGGFIPDNRISIGDTYAIFGIKIPTEYVINGEAELLRDAIRYKYENEDLRFTFKGEVNGIWSQKNWSNIQYKIIPGGYVYFSDDQFHPNGTLIRISGIKRYLYEPYKPILELTNIVIGGGLKGELSEIQKQEVIINEQRKIQQRLEYKNWRDTEETKRNIDIMFSDMGEALRGSSLEAMYGRFGHKMGQFRFVTGLNSNDIAINAPIFVYNSTTNIVTISGNTSTSPAYIQHQLINTDGDFFDMDGKSPSGDDNTVIRDSSEYKKWTIPVFTSNALDKEKYYWLYIRAPKNGSNADFIIEEYNVQNPRLFDDGTNYWLVVGGINSEFDGSRGFTPLFGFTEILPGQITTGLIRSVDGKTYFDLNSGIISGRITFISNNGTTQNVADVADEAQESKNYINNTLPGILSEMQSQIDGQIEQFFDTYDPTTDNAPANGWTTTDLKESHLGDLFYNTQSGAVFRWIKNGTTYSWQELQDSEVAEALALANEALALAGTKRRVFVSEPTTPYDIGDLWVGGPNGDIVRCVTSRQTGTYSQYDWALASKYTDNTVANNALNAANNAQNTANGKSKVFTSKPTVPYNIGDSWARNEADSDSTHPTGIYVCLQTRTSGSFTESDWSLRAQYDETQTIIDGGIVTTGRLEVGNGALGSVLSGITGDGSASNSIRIWAGNTYVNRSNAPFRVYQDGSFVSGNATITGIINAISGNIGNLQIIGGSILNDFSSPSSVVFRDDSNNIFCGIGTNVNPPSVASQVCARFERGTIDQYGTNIAANFSASGSLNNYAINIQKGCISGFAVTAEQTSDSSYLLEQSNCMLFCYGLNQTSVILPNVSSTDKGKVFGVKRMQNVGGQVRVYGTIFSTTSLSYIDLQPGIITYFINDGQYWQM